MHLFQTHLRHVNWRPHSNYFLSFFSQLFPERCKLFPPSVWILRCWARGPTQSWRTKTFVYAGMIMKRSMRKHFEHCERMTTLLMSRWPVRERRSRPTELSFVPAGESIMNRMRSMILNNPLFQWVFLLAVAHNSPHPAPCLAPLRRETNRPDLSDGLHLLWTSQHHPRLAPVLPQDCGETQNQR